MTKQVIGTLAFGLLVSMLGAENANAHCGKCGADAKHSEVEKAGYTERAEPEAPANIVETAKAAGSFKTLLAAADAAGLVETLAGKGPFTVFAPTDEAFDKLPEGTIEALLADKEKLAAVLTYHVVPGTVTAEQVVSLKSAKTVNGAEIKIRTDEGKVFVQDAEVVKTDIMCENGVIHVIDRVIIPS